MPINLPERFREPIRLMFSLGVLSESTLNELDVIRTWKFVRDDELFLAPRMEAIRANVAYERTYFEDFATFSVEEKAALRYRVRVKQANGLVTAL